MEPPFLGQELKTGKMSQKKRICRKKIVKNIHFFRAMCYNEKTIELQEVIA